MGEIHSSSPISISSLFTILDYDAIKNYVDKLAFSHELCVFDIF